MEILLRKLLFIVIINKDYTAKEIIIYSQSLLFIIETWKQQSIMFLLSL